MKEVDSDLLKNMVGGFKDAYSKGTSGDMSGFADMLGSAMSSIQSNALASQEKAAKFQQKAEKYSLIGNVLAGVGSLANTVNTAVQALQGRRAAKIGDPFTAFGGGLVDQGQKMSDQSMQAAKEALGMPKEMMSAVTPMASLSQIPFERSMKEQQLALQAAALAKSGGGGGGGGRLDPEVVYALGGAGAATKSAQDQIEALDMAIAKVKDQGKNAYKDIASIISFSPDENTDSVVAKLAEKRGVAARMMYDNLYSTYNALQNETAKNIFGERLRAAYPSVPGSVEQPWIQQTQQPGVGSAPPAGSPALTEQQKALNLLAARRAAEAAARSRPNDNK